ncbi:MAG: right-handed parallel beta-helix repeat-containing protein [Candidatus Odinarchaeota archaeon]
MARKRLIVCEFFILAMLILVIPPTTVFFENIANHQNAIEMYTLASDVIITSDNDWELQGWPGNGTIESPYLIDGIDANYVKISNSAKWFVIRHTFVRELLQLINATNGRIEFASFRDVSIYQSTNVTIISNNPQDFTSLSIYSCNHILIANNSINGAEMRYSGGKGIYACFSQDVKILNNSITEFCTGIEIENSTDCLIEKNCIATCGIFIVITVTYTTVPIGEHAFTPSQQYTTIEGEGIRLENCTNSRIIDNIIKENDCDSIVLGFCIDTQVYDNNMTMNRGGMTVQACISFNITSNLIDHGLTLHSSLAGVITHNKLISNGLTLEGDLEYLYHSISNNTVDDFPLIYIANVNSYALLTLAVAQIILVNCTQVIIQEVVTRTNLGIQVLFSETCRFRYIRSGYLFIGGSFDVVLEDSNINVWSGYGIAVDSSLKVFITENYLSCGILVQNHSNEVFVRNNTQREARASAIDVDSDSSNVFIERNDIRACGRIEEDYHWYINYYYPAIIVRGTNCSITENTIVDNYGIGIALHGSNITVCYNIIARNGQGNALDHGSGNFWDDGESRGNTWGDYIGFGYYYIPGSAGSIDRYPSLSSEFMEPYVIITWAIIIGTPLTLIILVGILIILRRRNRIQANKPVQIKRVGLG